MMIQNLKKGKTPEQEDDNGPMVRGLFDMGKTVLGAASPILNKISEGPKLFGGVLNTLNEGGQMLAATAMNAVQQVPNVIQGN